MTMRPEARQPKASAFVHRPPLDGIRAIAALLVVLFHASVPMFNSGYAGVDVFFVLSGFLITSLLARELYSTGRLDFIAFYARRARRLLPTALLVLLVTAVVYEKVASPLAVSENRGGFVAAALYVANWFFLARSADYFAETDHVSPVQHYWSLSVEEQYYLLWPAIILLLFLLARRYRLRLDGITLVLALVGLVHAWMLSRYSPMDSYFGTSARAYQLLLGAAVGLHCLRREQRESSGRHRSASGPTGAVLAAGGLAVLLLSASPLMSTHSAYWHGVVSAAGTAALILGLELTPTSSVASLLSRRPAVLLGGWSYAMYLWHWPVIVIGDEAGLLPGSWLPRSLLVVGLTVALSALTAYVVERPTGQIRLASGRRRGMIAAAGMIAAIVTATGCSSVLTVNERAQQLVAQSRSGIPGGIKHLSVGGHKSRVLIIGDSHAHFMAPAFDALAQERGFTLQTVENPGCPWPRVIADDPSGQVIPCDRLVRDKALRIARRTHPDTVLLISRSVLARPIHTPNGLVTASDPDWIKVIAAGSLKFVKQLHPYVGRIIILEPIAETVDSPVDCLSTGADPASCAAPAVDEPGTKKLERMWRGLPFSRTVDFDNVICPHGTCPAMDDGMVTHRDDNHLTLPYAVHIRHRFERALVAQGVVLTDRIWKNGP
jgi:peptidoglycan/LPS O-acetylase OafA/YrhL